MPNTVLIVDDDPHVVELVSLYLTHDGHQVLTAADGITALELTRQSRPDLVVLDLMLPGLDGLEVCRAVRQESDVPIVMLTARVEEEDRLAGLDLGADDYVIKPFSPRELAARVRAVLRRTARDQADQSPPELIFDALRVNLTHRTVYIGPDQVRPTPTEFRLLVMLMKEPGRIFTREQIIDRVFGYNFDGFDRTVDTHVSSLRRKLEATPSKTRYIHTSYGVGYKFGSG